MFLTDTPKATQINCCIALAAENTIGKCSLRAFLLFYYWYKVKKKEVSVYSYVVLSSILHILLIKPQHSQILKKPVSMSIMMSHWCISVSLTRGTPWIWVNIDRKLSTFSCFLKDSMRIHKTLHKFCCFSIYFNSHHSFSLSEDSHMV